MPAAPGALRRAFCLMLGAWLTLGCGASADAGALGGAPPARTPSANCRAGAGVSNSPQSIAEVVTLLNSLPPPVTIPCFMEALARPLSVHATSGVLSAQPAVGARSPRIFLFIGANTLSVAPEGAGANVIELGERRPGYRSLKAEIAFPFVEPLAPSAPFERVVSNEQYTRCASCHADETREAAGVASPTYVSEALRPPVRNQVSVASLRHELQTCDVAQEPYRCAMLDSLLSPGNVTEGQFPEEMATFE